MPFWKRFRFLAEPGVLVFLIVFFVYTASLVGMQNTQDFTNYALTKVFVSRQTLFIDADPQHTFYVDYAVSPVHHRIVSNREMGISLLGVPFFILGVIFYPVTISPFLGLHPDITLEHKLQVWTYAAIPFFIAVGVVLMYFLLKRITHRPYAAFGSIVLLAFGTLLWKYGTSFYRNGIGGIGLAIAALALLGYFNQRVTGKQAYIVTGISLGLVAITDYILWIPSALLFLAAAVAEKKKNRKLFFYFFLGYLPFLTTAMLYNQYLFGSPIVAPYSFDHYSRFMGTFFNNFQTPLAWGLWLNLFSNGPIPPQAIPWLLRDSNLALQQGAYFALANNYWGIFVQSPFLFFSAWGWVDYFRTLPPAKKWTLVFPLIPFLSVLLIMSKWTVFYSANIYDSRYMLPAVPIIAIGVVFILHKIRISPWLRILFLLAVFVSITRAFGAMVMSFGPNYSGEVRFNMTYFLENPWSPRMLFVGLVYMFPNVANLSLMGTIGLWVFLPIWKLVRKLDIRSWYN